MINEETKKAINEAIKRELGITYDEFALLDYDEQQRLIESNRKKKNRTRKKHKDNLVTVMIGSGEHAIFVKKKHGERYMLDDGTFVLAGDTSEESRARLEDKMDEAIYSKPVAFVKKIGRRIKNR